MALLRRFLFTIAALPEANKPAGAVSRRIYRRNAPFAGPAAGRGGLDGAASLPGENAA
jgi:hypothetical protein